MNAMPQLPTVTTSLTIICKSKELDFAALSKTLDRKADSTRSLDHVTASGRAPPVRSSEWTISTEAQVLDSIDAGVRQLLGDVVERWAGVDSLWGTNQIEVCVTSLVRIYDWEDRPIIQLDAASIGLLQKIGASWQLDWVDLSR